MSGKKIPCLVLAAWCGIGALRGQAPVNEGLLKASPLTGSRDQSAAMVGGISTFLDKRAAALAAERHAAWKARGAASGESWLQFAGEKRRQLRYALGMEDPRVKPVMEIATAPSLEQYGWKTAAGTVRPFRMNVLEGLAAEGIVVTPSGPIKARLILVPDADQLPEQLCGLKPDSVAGNAPALRLAAQGIQVVIPVLVSRAATYSGSPELNIYTNQPHREWLYRQGFDLGRHLIGYELQKIRTCLDWFENENQRTGTSAPFGVAGYGEGGLLALYTAALDTRVAATLVSGYVGNADSIWQQPIYRNIHGVLKHAGEAGLLTLGARDRPGGNGVLLVEYSRSPVVNDPLLVEGRRGGAAPGRLRTPELQAVEAEIRKAREYGAGEGVQLLSDREKPFSQPFSGSALAALGVALGTSNVNLSAQEKGPSLWIDAEKRQERTVREMEQRMQQVLERCETTRNTFFWEKIRHDPGKDQPAKALLREAFHETIGKIDLPLLAPSPRARLLESNAKWQKFEVVLNVWEDVFAWGILVVPANADRGKRYPVVVCQHGLEGLPDDVVTRSDAGGKFKTYKAMALALAEQGYVTFAPHNPYRGETLFRTLQRKANPLGLSLFSVIVGQHRQIVNWLGSLPFVDPAKIGFYGLSYGGKTAMRVPALVEGYALSICSGDFNEWVRKVSTTRGRFSYQFTKEYEIYEWNLGHTFNYAEMAALIAPRPFMFEYGYHDGIGTAEWIGYEFGKVRKHYQLSGLGERVDSDLFNGIHEIHGDKTYRFLDKHLKGKK